MRRDEASAFLRRAQSDPAWWMRHVLGAELWQKQREIAESVRDNKRTAVRSCHGIGKSWISARIALWWLLSHPGAMVATTAPTFRQVKKILWQEIAKAVEGARVPLGIKALLTEIKIAPGWFAFGFSSDDPNAAQGLHSEHMLLIYDEAAGIPEDTWDALEGALTSAHCRLLAIGNPTDPASKFADEFTGRKKGKEAKSANRVAVTCCFAVSAFDTPNFTIAGITLEDIVSGAWHDKQRALPGAEPPMPWLITPEWVADKVERWGVESPVFQARVMAKFPDVGDDTLIPLSWIERAAELELTPKPNHAKVLALDVARFGSDESVLGLRHGPVYRTIDAWRGLDTEDTADRASRGYAEVSASVIKVDGDGVGAGVVDKLKKRRKKVAEMRGGAAALEDERFANRRAEWFWNLREMFERGEVQIDGHDDDLVHQLSILKYRYDAKGRILIESKDSMRSRGIASPDRADTMAMAYGPDMPIRSRSTLLQAMANLKP